MLNHAHPIVEAVLDRNASRVIKHFEERHLRRAYLAEHPFHYIYIGCMDGRASHLPHALGIPIGCAELFQTAGAMFDVGWKYFSNLLTESVAFGLEKGREVIILVSSHFSGRYPDHGCRAFANDREAAHGYALRLAQNIAYVLEPYGRGIQVLPIEFDTDDDSIILHGDFGSMDTSRFLTNEHGMEHALDTCFSFPARSRIRAELVSLVRHNIDHVRAVLRNGRNHRACAHGEKVLFLGRGAGTWLNPERNSGIILFPEGERLSEYVLIAGKILASNMRNDSVLREHGAVVMPCSAYGDRRNQRIAEVRARSYAHTIETLFKQRMPKFRYTLFPATVDLTTWQLSAIT